jgi:hypothetical protein
MPRAGEAVRDRRERRLVAGHPCVESGGAELLVDGRQPLATLGMMPAHVVREAVGMGNERDGQ